MPVSPVNLSGMQVKEILYYKHISYSKLGIHTI